jgi:hypothetical protein
MDHLFNQLVLSAALGLGLVPAAFAAMSPVSASPDEARQIAQEAYVYAFPMLENYRTLFTQVKGSDPRFAVGGFNRWRNYDRLATPEARTIVTPNNDTPYSVAWLDLRSEPVVVSVPNVPADRYYVLQLFDLYTYNIGYIGSRLTGNGAGDFLVVGPGWAGGVPPGIRGVIHSETSIVGILGRTALYGANDMANVKAIQSGYRLTPLSAFVRQAAPEPLPELDLPAYEPGRARSHDFIGYLNFLLALAQPASASETELLQRFARIGIAPGSSWDASEVSPDILAAIDAGIGDAEARIAAASKSGGGSQGLFGSRATLGNNYLRRAVAAAVAIYGLDVEEAWYGGFYGDGTVTQKLHFAAGQLPPARFFWSVTLYQLPDRFLYANPLMRYSLGDRSAGLVRDADGGLTLYLGHDSPGAGLESNWIPAPAGPYSVVLRIYGPGAEVIKGNWKVPTLEGL